MGFAGSARGARTTRVSQAESIHLKRMRRTRSVQRGKGLSGRWKNASHLALLDETRACLSEERQVARILPPSTQPLAPLYTPCPPHPLVVDGFCLRHARGPRA